MDYKLPDWHKAAGEAGEYHIQHPINEHWLSPLLFSLYSSNCTSGDPTVKLLKFTDDTTAIGLIQDGEESAYRREVEQLVIWCGQNNLDALKTVEITVDFRRNPQLCSPLHSEQHGVCGDLVSVEVSGIYNLPGPEVGGYHQHHQEKGPAENVLPLPA